MTYQRIAMSRSRHEGTEIVSFPSGEEQYSRDLLREENPVRPINQYEFVELGAALNSLKSLRFQTVSLSALYRPLHEVSVMMTRLLDHPILKLGTCRPYAEKLRDQVEKERKENWINAEGERIPYGEWESTTLESWELGSLFSALEEFQTVLAAEMRGSPTYIIEKVNIFTTDDLLNNADTMVPSELLPYLREEAKIELRLAGKCLAYRQFTAAGFHFLRSVEIVFDSYYRKIAGSAYKEPKSWYDFKKRLEELTEADSPLKPAERVIRHINEIRELDRNPLMHPRASLDESSALILLYVCMGTICAVSAELKTIESGQQLQLIAASGSPAE